MVVSADGKSIRLDPEFNLDFGNKYHIESTAGRFQTVNGGLSDAVNGATFSTASQVLIALRKASQGLAQTFDKSGAVVDCQGWVDITGNGRVMGAQVHSMPAMATRPSSPRISAWAAPDSGIMASEDGVSIDGDLNML